MVIWNLVLFVFCVGTMLLLRTKRNRRGTAEGKPLPTPPRIPIVGNLVLAEYSSKRFAELGKTLGGVYLLRLMHIRFVVICDWRILKEALVGQSATFSGRPKYYTSQQITHNYDIASIDGPLWKAKRCLVMNYLRNLGFNKKSMECSILAEISKVRDVLQKHRVIEVKELFFVPLLNILWSLVTGKRYDYDDVEMKRLKDMIRRELFLVNIFTPVNGIPLLRFLPGDPFRFHEMLRQTREIEEYLEKEVAEHEKSFRHGSGEHDNLVDVYLKDILEADRRHTNSVDQIYHKKHLIGTMLDLLIAGMDTSTSTLEWSLLYMVRWPEKQKKVREEICRVVGSGRSVNYEDIARLPYTEATILETHRYATILPLSIPHRTTTDTVLGGYHVPGDTPVLVNLWAINHDDTLWQGDPHVFRPERFIGADGTVRRPEHFIPFLVGSRSCIGASFARMQLFLFFASLMQRFTFSCPDGVDPPSLKPANERALSMEPSPYRLVVTANDTSTLPVHE